MSTGTYNKVTQDASRDSLAKLAVAAKQGPDASRAAAVDTDFAVVKVSGDDEGERS